MADESVEIEAGGGGGSQRPTLFIILAIVNMLIVAGVGVMLYMAKLRDAAEPGIDQVVRGELEAQGQDGLQDTFIGRTIPMETFLVNLAGSRGRQIAKVNMEFEISNDPVAMEIEQKKAAIRDIIIILLSSKTYEQVASREGKDALRDEIRHNLNTFLSSGRIQNVFFTEFIYN